MVLGKRTWLKQDFECWDQNVKWRDRSLTAFGVTLGWPQSNLAQAPAHLFRGALRAPLSNWTCDSSVRAQDEGDTCTRRGFFRAIWSHERPCRILHSGKVRAAGAALVFQIRQCWLCVWREGQTYGTLPKVVRDDPQGWLSQQSNFITLTLPRASDTSYIKCTTLSCSSRRKIGKPQEIHQFCVLGWKKHSRHLAGSISSKDQRHSVLPFLLLSQSIFLKENTTIHPSLCCTRRRLGRQQMQAYIDTKGKGGAKGMEKPSLLALIWMCRECTDLYLPVRTCSALIPHCWAPPTSLTMSSPIMMACQDSEIQGKFISAICHPPLT